MNKSLSLFLPVLLSGCITHQVVQVDVYHTSNPDSSQSHTTLSTDSKQPKSTQIKTTDTKTTTPNKVTIPTKTSDTVEDKKPIEVVTKAQAGDRVIDNPCIYQMPELLNMPLLPDELKTSTNLTYKELTEIIIPYIKEMRDVSSKNRELLYTTHKDYLEKCQKLSIPAM